MASAPGGRRPAKSASQRRLRAGGPASSTPPSPSARGPAPCRLLVASSKESVRAPALRALSCAARSASSAAFSA
eukprot:2130582-Pleurochrysis_carterae.AAC.1